MFISETEDFDFKKWLAGLLASDAEVKPSGNFEDEYEALRYGVGVNVYEPSHFEIKGKDAENFLQKLITGNIKSAEGNILLSSLFLNEKGGIIDRVKILREEEKFTIVGNKIYEGKLHLWFQRYLNEENLEIKPVNNFLFFEFLGLQANSFVGLIAEEFDEQSKNIVIEKTIENFTVLFFKDEINGYVRYGALVPKANAKTFGEYLSENKSVFNLKSVGKEAYEVFRIENCIPIAPNEINDEISPVEINLQEEIDLSKSYFIGYERIRHKDGIFQNKKKEPAVLLFDKDSLLDVPFSLEWNKNEIGKVTSKTYSKRLNAFVGIGIVEKELKNGFDEIEINAGNENFNVQLLKHRC